MISELMTHLWQSTLFAVAAALLTVAFRRNRAKVRFWLWLSASLKFFIPFVLLMNLGGHLRWTPAAQRIATQIATPAVSFAVEYVAQPFSGPSSFGPVAPRSTDWIPTAIIGLWACGFLVIALIRLQLWHRVRAAVRASTALEIPAAVEIRSSPGLLEPGVVGLLNPVLLLPEGIMDRLTSSQLEAVLAHELCHVRRRDNLFASIHMIVEALFWFHPLVWWIGARLVDERERACDEDVLSLGNQPRAYADAILNVCKLYAESPLVCVSGVTGANIRKRIEAIMTNRKGQTLNRAKKVLLASAGFAALAGPVVIGVVIGIGHVPAIHAQSPVAVPSMLQVAIPTLAQAVQATPFAAAKAATDAAPPTTVSDLSTTSIVRYQDRRLVAMMFDFSTMTADDQARIRAAGVNFVQNELKPTDLACIILVGAGSPSVAQDFTDNQAQLVTAVQALSVAENNPAPADVAAGTDARLANIAAVSKMLAPFPQKKALMYFSSGLTQSGVDNQAVLMQTINTAKQANVALFPIDTRGATASPPVANTSAPGGLLGGIRGDLPAISGGGRGPGRGAAPPAVPAGVSQDEYNQRVAYAQAKFDSVNGAMSRSYIRYGAPDQIDTPASGNSQIWRYNYLEDFHGGAAFEFTSNSSLAGRIVYPPSSATFEGHAASVVQLASLSAALAAEPQRPGTSAATSFTAGLPGRHVSAQVYPAGPGSAPAADRRFVPISVPLDSLSGQIDVIGQMKTRPATGAEGSMVAMVRNYVSASTGTFQSGFTLPPGSYLFNVLVKEQATGRTFGETINIDVQ